jgi:hypothetical protein
LRAVDFRGERLAHFSQLASTLLNLVTLGVAEQASLEADARAPISIFVDNS